MSPSTAFQFDREALLRPVSEASPLGEPLQFSDVLDRIREAQREDDATVNRGVWTFGLKRADWVEVERLCVETLKTKAKDIQVAAMLVEAWVQRYGFAGLREGFGMLSGLVDNYGSLLFPPDADDLDYRISPFEWLNDKLSLRLKLVSITNPTGSDVQPSSFSDFEREGGPDYKKQKAGPTVFQQSMMLTPTDYFIELIQELEGCMEAFGELEVVLDQALGSHAPSLRRLSGVLQSIRNFVADFLEQRDVPADRWNAPAAAAATPVDMQPLTPDASEFVYSSRPIGSRDEAYQLLAEAAEYLARTEPHSPAPYLIKRAIAWGTMTFDMLLPELVRNDAERQEIFRLLQIPMPGK